MARKSIHVVIHEHKIRADREVMNSDQRLELSALHNAAEFGALCLDNWPLIQKCLAQDPGSERKELLNSLSHLYEVSK